MDPRDTHTKKQAMHERQKKEDRKCQPRRVVSVPSSRRYGLRYSSSRHNSIGESHSCGTPRCRGRCQDRSSMTSPIQTKRMDVPQFGRVDRWTRRKRLARLRMEKRSLASLEITSLQGTVVGRVHPRLGSTGSQRGKQSVVDMWCFPIALCSTCLCFRRLVLVRSRAIQSAGLDDRSQGHAIAWDRIQAAMPRIVRGRWYPSAWIPGRKHSDASNGV